jgi:hypothetical protein
MARTKQKIGQTCGVAPRRILGSPSFSETAIYPSVSIATDYIWVYLQGGRRLQQRKRANRARTTNHLLTIYECADLVVMPLHNSRSTTPRGYVLPYLLPHLARALVLSLLSVCQMCFNCLDVEFESMLICTECKSLALCRNCIVVDKREDTTVFTCFACATKKGETLPVCKSLPLKVTTNTLFSLI